MRPRRGHRSHHQPQPRRRAAIADPDKPPQHLTAARALRELQRIRQVTITTGDNQIGLITRTNPHQRAILDAIGVDTTTWASAATIT